MNMKNFIEDFNEVDKFERYDMIGENINGIIDFMLEKSKDNALRERAVKMIASKKFAKCLKKVVKKREFDISLNLVTVLSSLLSDLKFGEEEGNYDTEVKDCFFYIIETMVEKKVKKISRKTDIPSPVIINLVLECPESLESDDVSTGRMHFFINKLIKKFYMIPSIKLETEDDKEKLDYTDIDKWTKVVKLIIGGNRLKNFAIDVLLEPNKRMESLTSEQAPVYNLLTDMALNILNDMKSKEAGEMIEKCYIKQRIYADSKEYKDTKRRLSLLMVDEEKYPKLAKAVKELAKNEKNKKYLG